MEKVDGGPAFPTDAMTISHGAPPSLGMTLRDWFAGQLLAGLINQPDWWTRKKNGHAFAVEAYELADSMLEARSK